MFNWKGFVVNYRVWRRQWFYPLISVVVAFLVCLSTPLPSQAFSWFDLIRGGVQVLQLSNISESQEIDIGKQINQELLSGDVRLYRNSEVTSYVQQVGRRVAANSTRPNLPYTFQVVDNDTINAFATLGGYVYVHTGLLKAAENEAELAGVLGHEIGHIEGKHVIKQMRQNALENGLLSAAGLDRNRAVQIGLQVARNLPRSRQNEFEADQKGLRTLTRTGYAQSAMVTFMKKLLGRSSTPSFLSSHPATGDRVTQLQSSISSQTSNNTQGLDSTNYKANIRSLLRS